MNQQQGLAGVLFVVATPIGNLDDITFRAVRTLKEVDYVASEDTRRTKNLLNHLGISKPTISYYREKEKQRSKAIIDLLLQGKHVALVSDAGTPCVSDPGALLVHEALKHDIQVVPIPGPSALTAGFSISGLLDGTFLFVGFLPHGRSARRKLLTSLLQEKHSIAFYESPKRILGTLQDLKDLFGDRHLFVARELTKIHEEYFSGSAGEIYQVLFKKDRIRGEFVIFVEKNFKSQVPPFEELQELLRWYRDEKEYSLSETAKIIAKDLGLARSHVYAEALKIW